MGIMLKYSTLDGKQGQFEYRKYIEAVHLERLE